MRYSVSLCSAIALVEISLTSPYKYSDKDTCKVSAWSVQIFRSYQQFYTNPDNKERNGKQ